MSSFAGYCGWCTKPVMHKTLFGTLHVCLTDEEKTVYLQKLGELRANARLSRKLGRAAQDNNKGDKA